MSRPQRPNSPMESLSKRYPSKRHHLLGFPGTARLIPSFALGMLLVLLPACHVHSGTGPPQITGTGLVRGHIALGLREEDEFLRFRASLSPDSSIEFSLWKLFRFDIGLVGASVGVGPIDVALGTLFYDPTIPQMMEWGGEGEGAELEGETGWEEDPELDSPPGNQPCNADDQKDRDRGDSSWRDAQ